MPFDRPNVYLTIRELDRADPAMVRRKGNNVIVAWDPRYTRFQIADWLIFNLPREEVDVLAFGLGLSWPLPDWSIADRPASLYVPPALRLPGDDALQGGRQEMLRRSAREMAVDRARYRAERLHLAVPDLQLVDDLAYA